MQPNYENFVEKIIEIVENKPQNQVNRPFSGQKNIKSIPIWRQM